MWTMSCISSKTTDACLADSEQYPGWSMLGRQPRSADLVPDIRFPWWDKDGGSRWFSCLKKSSMSASGRAFSDKNSLVMSAAFALADPSFVEIFFRSTGGLLLKVYKPALGMTSDKGFEAFSILSRTNYLNIAWPIAGASLKQFATSGSMTSPVSSVIRSGPVSLKGLMMVPSSTRLRRAFRSLMNLFCSVGEASGWSRLHSLFEGETLAFSNSSIARSTSGFESSIISYSSCWPYSPLAPLSSLELDAMFLTLIKCHVR